MLESGNYYKQDGDDTVYYCHKNLDADKRTRVLSYNNSTMPRFKFVNADDSSYVQIEMPEVAPEPTVMSVSNRISLFLGIINLIVGFISLYGLAEGQLAFGLIHMLGTAFNFIVGTGCFFSSFARNRV